MSESNMPSNDAIPQQVSNSGSIWGRVAIAAVAGLAGVVVGALMSEQNTAGESDESDDKDNSGGDDVVAEKDGDGTESSNNVAKTLLSTLEAISLFSNIVKSGLKS